MATVWIFLALFSVCSFARSQVTRDCSRTPPILPVTVVDTTSRISQLRSEMLRYNNLQAYLVTPKDAHQSEYTAPVDMRLKYMSGFDGYRGIAVVTQSEALLWMAEGDRERAEELVDCNWKLMIPEAQDYMEPEHWLAGNIAFGRIGVDPEYISYGEFEKFSEVLNREGLELSDITGIVDTIWEQEGRPQRQPGPLRSVPYDITGRDWRAKVQDIRGLMEEKNVGVVVLSDLTDVAWLFNLRGEDVPYNPVFFAYAIVMSDRVNLYLEQSRIDSVELTKCTLPGDTSNCVSMGYYTGFTSDLAQLAAGDYGVVWFEDTTSYAVYDTVSRNGADFTPELSPVKLLRTQKNSREQQAIQNVLLKDSVAVCEFLYWLEEEVVTKGSSSVTESSTRDKLAQFRQNLGDYKGDSIPPVSAFGTNTGTMDHMPARGNDKTIRTDGLYLFDSGAQYTDGVTDMSRTVHLGTPTDEEARAYTRVLQGLISLSTAVFPEGTYGDDIDVLARRPLWQDGMEYSRATGHGFGTFVVHESPTRIARPESEEFSEDDLPFQSNMYFSNEPGCYREGSFGIRLEVIMKVTDAEIENRASARRKFMTFKVESLVPFEPKLISENLLTPNEILWLNEYNQQVLDVVGAELTRLDKTDVYDWLKEKTRPYSVGAACKEVNESIQLSRAANFTILSLFIFLSIFYLL
ncbi:xaa-Pro aminopeptidase 1-like [Ptychodera flava]|uniref:xaa-Pro aminopeptidase 1-like n=1 Tax=Ptychodera flava TaxID=63121 RepID=UPI00396A49D5